MTPSSFVLAALRGHLAVDAREDLSASSEVALSLGGTGIGSDPRLPRPVLLGFAGRMLPQDSPPPLP